METNKEERVKSISRESKEDELVSFLTLNSGYYLPEEIEKSLGWKKGTASPLMSRMYGKKKLHRKTGYRGANNRESFVYRRWEEGDPEPEIRGTVARVTNEEVYSVVSDFLAQQDPEQFFTGEELAALDVRFTSVYSHLAQLHRNHFLERKKVPRGARGQRVFGYRLPLNRAEDKQEQQEELQKEKPSSGIVVQFEENPDSMSEEESKKEGIEVKELPEANFSEKRALYEVIAEKISCAGHVVKMKFLEGARAKVPVLSLKQIFLTSLSEWVRNRDEAERAIKSLQEAIELLEDVEELSRVEALLREKEDLLREKQKLVEKLNSFCSDHLL